MNPPALTQPSSGKAAARPIRGTLFGAVLGTLVVRAAQPAVSESFPDLWQYAIGALFILTVLLFPTGLIGFLRSAGRFRWLAN